jgi:hypothetical protein
VRAAVAGIVREAETFNLRALSLPLGILLPVAAARPPIQGVVSLSLRLRCARRARSRGRPESAE